MTTFKKSSVDLTYKLSQAAQRVTIKYNGLRDDGDCFIAFNFTSGALFKSDKIYLQGYAEFDRDEQQNANLVTNPTYQFMPSTNAPNGFTDTLTENIYLFFDCEKMFLYNFVSKQSRYIGNIGKSP